MKDKPDFPNAGKNALDDFAGSPGAELSRREFLIGSAAFGASIFAGPVFAAADGKKTFTILHTNDMHSNFIGMGRRRTIRH
jgi:hypothetical protein